MEETLKNIEKYLKSIAKSLEVIAKNTTEKIKINTDYITEDEGKAFEYLINSPEVMLLDSYIDETTSEFQEKANNQ